MVRAKLVISISYPTSASGIIVLLKTPIEIPQSRLQSLQNEAMLTAITNLESFGTNLERFEQI